MSEVIKIEDQKPEFLSQLPVEGVDLLGEFIQPPRLKVIQKQSDDALLELFSVGDVISSPLNVSIAGKGESFAFAPIFFWPEWCTWAPYELKGTVKPILYRTQDHRDPLVQLSRNEATRQEAWPELVNGKEVFKRHCEHLNFIFLILSGPYAGNLVTVSFLRAQHQDGARLAQLIKMRNAPIYSLQFEAKSYQKAYSGNAWYGLQSANPVSTSPFVQDEETFNVRKELYAGFNEAYQKGQIIVDFDEDATESADSVSDTQF